MRAELLRLVRHSRRRAVYVGASLAVVALAAAATAVGESNRGKAASAGGTLTMARVADIFTMDPVQTIDDRSIFTNLQIYDRLVKLSRDGKSVDPELATKWTISKGGRQALFTLRKGVEFSDGSPLTSADVVAAINRERDAKAPWSFLIAPVKSVTAVGPTKVKFTMAEPFAPLLPALSTFAFSIYSKKQFAKYGKGLGSHPLGTGAFMLQSWKKGSELDLVRNPNYWQKGKPHLDKVVFKVVGDDNARVLQLQSGAADVIDSVPPNQVEAIKSHNDKVESIFGSAVGLLVLNTQKSKGPFADKNARCAVAWSVDRSAVARNAYFGLAQPAKSSLPNKTLYWSGNQSAPGYDLTKAKAFLAKSSVPKGFTFSVDVDSGDSPAATALQIWAASLKKIGITMKVTKLEATTVQDRFNTQKFAARYVPWTNDTPDPDEQLGAGLDYKGPQHSLFTSYVNRTAYKLMVKARSEMKAAKRAALYAKVQRSMNTDCSAFIPIVDLPRLYASGPNVVGFSPNSQGKYSFENVSKK
jgi:peptide/nickel transport system substrate-binding protein